MMSPRTLVFGVAVLALTLCGSEAAWGKTCSSITVSAPSGAGNDITFTFDAAYECGEFANGDPWAVVSSSGSVTITSITPARGAGHDGWNVNPTDIDKQPYDQRISDYDSSQQPGLPYAAKAGTSVVKAVSLTPLTDTGCRPCLKFAAVLTVLASAPTTQVFRPPYFGGGAKTPRKVSELKPGLIPALDTSCASSAGTTKLDWVTSRFRHVQLDHKTNWVGRHMHPEDNLPDYGADIATDNGVAALRLMLDDFDPADAGHKQALINYVQAGLDWARMAELGMSWPANGGHSNGRKLPVVFAGVVLDDAQIQAIAGKAVYSENQQIYFSSKADGGKGQALYGQDCGDSGYWQHIRYGNGSRTCADPYGYIDGGGDEIGGAYQTCCTAKPWKYTALAVRLLQAESIFKYDPLLSYVDRWMQLGVWAKPDPCAPYDGNPDNYGKTYGPDSTGDCIKGSGRYTAKHGTNKAGGLYGSGFGDEMWTCFRACTPNCQGQPGMDGGVITDAGAGADATVTGDKGVGEAGVVADSATTDGATADVDGGGADRGDDGCSCAVGIGARIRGRSIVSLAPVLLIVALCLFRRRLR